MSLSACSRVTAGVLLVGALALDFLTAAPIPSRRPQDFVWRVQGSTGTLYLAGSLHELRAGDRPSLSLYVAYARCDRAVFEADLAEFERPAFRTEVNRLAAQPQGRTLASQLDPVTAERIKVVARRNGLPEDAFNRFRPWYAVSYASLLIIAEAGFQEDHGVDRYFFDRARREGKALEFLETGRQQLELLTLIPDSEAIESLRQDLADGVNLARSLVKAWESGDTEKFERLSARDALTQPVSYQRFLVERNLAWLPRLERWLGQTNCTLVVVGAGHLVGTNGLVHQLVSRGHRVVQLPEAPSGKTRKENGESGPEVPTPPSLPK